MTRTKVVLAVVALAAAVLPAAAAKDFKPGDLRVCDRTRCLQIRDAGVLTAIGAFYYQAKTPPTRARAPSPRSRYVKLEFRNGYVTGVAAGARFDRFLSFGVNLDRFMARTWYVIPARFAAEIRRLASQLRPESLPSYILDLSH
jgi:hypothetical protein